MNMIEHFAKRIPCGVYEHYKGKRYFVISLGREDPSDEVVVLYCRLYGREGLPLSVRRAENFLEEIEWRGRMVPRFAYVGLSEPGGAEESPSKHI